MELKHSLESVTKGDKSSKRGDEIQGATEFRKTAGFIYMPIFIPSFGGGGLIESPTKQAHILCVTDANVVNEPNRLIDANKTLAEARLKKWFRRQ